MAYTFILEDLAGNALSELPGATAKRFARAINAPGTASVTVPLWHEFANYMLQGDALLKVVDVDDDDGTRVVPFHGRLVGANEVAESGRASVTASFADGFWELTKRLCGKSTAGYVGGTPLALIKGTQVFTDLINGAIATAPMGIRLGTVTPSATDSVAVGPFYYTKISDVLTQVSATLDGPDWRVDPLASAVATSNPSISTYCEMTVAPALGTTRLDQPFDYGTGRLNVRNYQRAVSNDGLATAVYSLPAGFPEQTGTVVSASDGTAQGVRGLLEDVVPTQLTVDQMRQSLVDLHVSVRKGPRQTITFQPVSSLSGDRLPRLMADYDVGDVVPFHAAIERANADGSLTIDRRFNALVRIYQVAVDVDPESGAGQPSITVTPS